MAARISLHISIGLGFFLLLFALFVALQPKVLAAGATLSFSPTTISTSQGQTFNVNIALDTGGDNTDGSRVLVNYDQNFLTVSKITPGTIYSDYPTNAQLNDPGSLKISGVAATGTTYAGSGTFATVSFIAKAAGTTQIKFDFAGQGVPNDSNVAKTVNDSAVDILASVNNATVTIASTGGGGATPVGSSGTNPTVAPRTGLPNTADITPTIVLSAAGGFLLLLGSILLFAL